jgi:hypothetical protein
LGEWETMLAGGLIVTPYNCVQVVLGSNPGREAACPDCFLCFPLVPPGKCWNNTYFR